MPPDSIDDYIATAPPDKRAALRSLRRTIRAAAPEATEYIGYGMAGYKHRGKALIYFAHAKEHVGLYGGALVKFTKDLKGYETTKGSVHLDPGKAIPASLVTRIVKDRVAEIDRGAGGYAAGVRRSSTTTRPKRTRDAKTSVLTRKPTKIRRTPSSSPR